MPATSAAGRKLRAFHFEIASLKRLHAPELKELMETHSPLEEEQHVRITRSIAILAKVLQERYNVVPMKDWNGNDILFRFQAYPNLPPKVQAEWRDVFEDKGEAVEDEDDEPATADAPKEAPKEAPPRPFGWGASL